MPHVRSSTCIILALAALPASAAAQGAAIHGPGAAHAAAVVPASELEAIRAATEKYQDVKVALAEGYILPMDMCVTAALEGQPAQLGAMGLHYVRPDLLGITGTAPRVDGNGTHTDFSQPAVLVYEPQADGSQKLVAIENLVWAKAWKDAGNTAAPSFHGNDYYYMHDHPATDVDEAHGFEPHYELHMWLYQDNPAGLFAPFNTAVSCAQHRAHGGH